MFKHGVQNQYFLNPPGLTECAVGVKIHYVKGFPKITLPLDIRTGIGPLSSNPMLFPDLLPYFSSYNKLTMNKGRLKN